MLGLRASEECMLLWQVVRDHQLQDPVSTAGRCATGAAFPGWHTHIPCGGSSQWWSHSARRWNAHPCSSLSQGGSTFYLVAVSSSLTFSQWSYWFCEKSQWDSCAQLVTFWRNTMYPYPWWLYIDYGYSQTIQCWSDEHRSVSVYKRLCQKY